MDLVRLKSGHLLLLAWRFGERFVGWRDEVSRSGRFVRLTEMSFPDGAFFSPRLRRRVMSRRARRLGPLPQGARASAPVDRGLALQGSTSRSMFHLGRPRASPSRRLHALVRGASRESRVSYGEPRRLPGQRGSVSDALPVVSPLQPLGIIRAIERWVDPTVDPIVFKQSRRLYEVDDTRLHRSALGFRNHDVHRESIEARPSRCKGRAAQSNR
ncbi:hypothetical protein AWB75_07116 [Caballeronia catudaia]|uniref:Uncharacterized protein n=1 Tax=Caballeronia catudaia TaxID=1777136 RepID=A0A158DS51_9BURK|nr:hypothetical protein AWB75_07116 [Caballeronia catudaia]